MTDTELLITESFSCRYCLEEDVAENLVAPCRCTGSIKYVHKKCLSVWFAKKNNDDMVIPGKINQFNPYCELCKTNYKVKYTNIENNYSLCMALTIYFSVITGALVLSYGLFGMAMESNNIILVHRDTAWENIFLNGFLFVHMVIGFFYFCVISCCRNSDVSTSMGFFGAGFFMANPSCDSHCEGECLMVAVIGFIVFGIFGTVLCIYIDVLGRVVQRHENRYKVISEIKNYT